MAQPNTSLDQFSVANQIRYLNRTAADTILESRVLLAWLKEGGRYIGDAKGDPLREPLWYLKNTTNRWMGTGGYDELDMTPQEGLTAAQYTLRQIAGTVTMSKLELMKNSGDNLIDLWDFKINQEKESMADDLNEDLYKDGTQESGAMVGLDGIIGTSGTFAGISRTTWAFWRANVDSTSEALSLADIRDMALVAGHNTSGGKSDLILTTRTLYTKLMTLLESTTYPVQQDARIARLGFESILVMGIPVSWDNACPSGSMYFLNSKYLKLRYNPMANFTWVEKNPARQLVKAMACDWAGVLTTNNPRYLGALRNKTA